MLWAEENPTISSGSSAPKPKAIPKALPVKSSTNKDADVNRKALRALPLVPSDPEVEVKPLRALPVNKDNEEVENNNVKNDDDQGNEKEKEKKAPPKKFELPPLPPINDLDFTDGDKKKSNIKAAWETKTEARTLTLKVPAPRGQITDRNGEALAQNKLGFFVALKFPYLEDRRDENIINYANERIDFVSS